MTESADRPFDWVAGLALASGIAVIIPSIAGLAVALLAVVALLF